MDGGASEVGCRNHRPGFGGSRSSPCQKSVERRNECGGEHERNEQSAVKTGEIEDGRRLRSLSS